MREIDSKAAALFLEIITRRGQVTFQTFYDGKEKRPALSKIMHGWNEKNLERLIDINTQGAGVFLMVNEGDGEGRSTNNVVAVRAVFVDLDGAPLEPIIASGIEPHLTVESSSGNYHAYWLVSDCPLDQFGLMQQALAKRFNADKSVHDLPRVMRVPGFYHQKGEPFQTRILSNNADLPPYSLADFKKIIDLPNMSRDTATRRIRENRSPRGNQHYDLKTYMVGLRKAGLRAEEINILVERWVRENNPDAKTHEALLAWVEREINPTDISFSDLVRIKSDPVAWRLTINDQEVRIPITRDLDTYKIVRRITMEQLGIVLPRKTAKQWDEILDALMFDLVDEEMPDDVSPMGMAWEATLDFLTGKVSARCREELLLGKPWRDQTEGRYYFTIKDLNKSLSHKNIFVKPRDIGSLLRDHKGKDTTLFIKGKTVRVWWLPAEEVDHNEQKEDFDVPKISESY